MSKERQVLCRAKVKCINPVNNQFTYAKGEFTFTIGGKSRFKEVPRHWEEIQVAKVEAAPSEAESMLEMQLKSLNASQISQHIMVHYGVKIGTGQAQETAFHQAIAVIRDPDIKRLPDSQILAGLATISDDTPEKKDDDPPPLPKGQAAAVVPAKGNPDGHKLFKDMNADDIDALDVQDIIPLVHKMYGVEMANAGNKTVRLNKALEIEAAALATKGILDRDK